jgi:hypothetical protein
MRSGTTESLAIRISKAPPNLSFRGFWWSRNVQIVVFIGGPCWDRTSDLPLRRRLLYPLS